MGEVHRLVLLLPEHAGVIPWASNAPGPAVLCSATLALAALAVLTICAADAASSAAAKTSGLIKLTTNDTRRLINLFVIRPVGDLAHRLHWSGLRRLQQVRARWSHYIEPPP